MIFCLYFLSWSVLHSARRDLQSDCSASSLHHRWLHDVDQPFHHWDDLSISSGQSVPSSTHPFYKPAVTMTKQKYTQTSRSLAHVFNYTTSNNVEKKTFCWSIFFRIKDNIYDTTWH